VIPSEAERKLNKRLLSIVAVLLVAVVIGAAYYYVFSPVIVEGIVDHKAVTGIKVDTSYDVLLNAPWGIIIKDKDYARFFSEKDRNAFINKSLEDEMKTEYSEINYLVSIRVSSKDPVNGLEKGATLAYFVSRDDFNKLRIGDKVKYEVARFQAATIKRLLQYGADCFGGASPPSPKERAEREQT